MAEIIEWSPNKLQYPHIICSDCHNNSFHIKTSENEMFYSIICTNCGNEVFCDLQPVFGPNAGGNDESP